MSAPPSWRVRRFVLALSIASALAACRPDAPPPSASADETAATSTDRERAHEEAMRKLEALGYLGGEQEREGSAGVRVHDPERAWPGLNLYTCGHAPEALLMDMQGRVLHRWGLPFKRAFPKAPPDPVAESHGRHHWRRTYLLPDGGLIAIYEGQGLLRLDSASRIVWKSEIRAHHAAQVLPSGELYVLTRKVHANAAPDDALPIAEDFVSVLDLSSGDLLRETSLLRALERSSFGALVRDSHRTEGDLFHTNSLEVLDGRTDRFEGFQEGSYLVSSRVLNAIFVVDPRGRKGRGIATWAQRGSWRSQHEAHVLDSGDILLFDNSGADPYSRVLEIPITPAGRPPKERVVYSGSPDRRFYSKFCGAVARLPNGGTLITETGPGRAFEITPAGEIVWEFVNPHDTDGKVASIYELLRLPVSAIEGWEAALDPAGGDV